MWKPYHDSYHNSISVLVNMQIVVTLFATLLIKIDNEMEESFSYEAGYNLRTIGYFLIFWNFLILLEFARYLKSAIEFATAVVIVRCEGNDVMFEEGLKGLGLAVKNGQTCESEGLEVNKSTSNSKSIQRLDSDYVVKSNPSRDGPENNLKLVETKESFKQLIDIVKKYCADVKHEKFKGKVKDSSLEEFASEISDAEALVKRKTTLPSEFKEKRRRLRKITEQLASQSSLVGSYFPLHERQHAYPQKSIFQQLFEFLVPDKESHSDINDSGGEDERTLWERALWWKKDVYIHDSSGWILRRSTKGWQLVPNAEWSTDEKPEFEAEGAAIRPPSSGWESIACGRVELTVRSPFRGCVECTPEPETQSGRNLLQTGSRDLTTSLLSDQRCSGGLSQC